MHRCKPCISINGSNQTTLYRCIQRYRIIDKSEQGIAKHLGLRSQWQAHDYLSAMRNFKATKVMQIISAIRECDAKSKGIGNTSVSDGELIRELVFFILH